MSDSGNPTIIVLPEEEQPRKVWAYWEGEPLYEDSVPQDVIASFAPSRSEEQLKAMLSLKSTARH